MPAFERRYFAVAVVLGRIYLALIPLKPYPLRRLLKQFYFAGQALIGLGGGWDGKG